MSASCSCVTEVWGDLFAMPMSIAHAVSADFHMGSGIATAFKEYFGRVDELLLQGKGVGQVAYLQDKHNFIFYMVTKDKYHGWPTHESVVQCLRSLRDLCLDLGVLNVAMPRISCGLDKMLWRDVLPLIESVFCECRVQVKVVMQPPLFQSMAVLGDSQGLRFLLEHCTLPQGVTRRPFPKSVGLCTSGLTISGLIAKLNLVPDSGLGDVLVFVGTNDLVELCSAEMGKRDLKRAIRGNWAHLRAVLSSKCRSASRAIVLTVPPLPKLLLPSDGSDSGEAKHLLSEVNKGLLALNVQRFRVLDLNPFFTDASGAIKGELFERSIGHQRREDRLHISKKGMKAIIQAVQTVLQP